MLWRCSSRAWSSSPGHGGQSRPISSQPLVSLSLAPSRITERRPAIFRRALARTHPDLSGLLGDRLIGEDVDPHFAAALEVVRDRAPRGLDLTRGHPAGLHRLQSEIALRDGVARLRRSLHAAALELTVLETLRLQHQAPARAVAGPVCVIWRGVGSTSPL